MMNCDVKYRRSYFFP